MAHELDSLWETSSGLPLDGATVTIADAVFGYNDHFPGKVCFNVKFLNEGDGQVYDQSFTVGNQGRASADGGKELVDPPKRMNNQSNFGRLVHAARELIESPGEVLGSPFVAAGWIGTRWELGTVEREVPVDIANPAGDKKITRPLTFITFLGKGSVPGGAAVSSGGQASAASPTTNGHGEKWGELVEFAKGFETHDAFMEAALGDPRFADVEKNAELRKGLYMDKPGSIWAEAKG